MRNVLAMFVVLSGVVLATGCGETPPKPPEGFVDPSTDPAAMGATLDPDLNKGTPPPAK